MKTHLDDLTPAELADALDVISPAIQTALVQGPGDAVLVIPYDREAPTTVLVHDGRMWRTSPAGETLSSWLAGVTNAWLVSIASALQEGDRNCGGEPSVWTEPLNRAREAMSQEAREAFDREAHT